MSSRDNQSDVGSESFSLRRRDRFDDLALGYAESYLGRKEVNELIKGSRDTTLEPSAGFLDGFGQRLQGLGKGFRVLLSGLL